MDKFEGKRLDGRYEIIELIGVGGMANVYKANDNIENKLVAIKILKEELSKDENFLKSFKNESKAIASLSHPNIVKIMDVSFGDRIQYIVMEYVDGITLKEYIDQVKILKWKDVVHFTVQILRALQHAHDKGIVHRDIKPHNMMLMADGTIKVMDFGIARFARDEAQIQSGTMAIGSVHYISPEQARAELTDEKSDVYSVGVMMYEMLTGKLPFEEKTPEKIALLHMQGNAKLPREINDTIPEGLEEIVVRAMQKDPKMRYQSAAEMLRDIDEFKKNPSIVFEYKYFSDEGTTKYFDSSIKNMALQKEAEEIEETKKSSTIPILTAVASAFVIVTILILVGFMVFGNNKKGDVVVPNLVGVNFEEAKKANPNLVFETPTTEWSDTYEAGIIFEQSIKEKTSVKQGTKIKVKVSLGKKKYPIPDVRGMLSADAIEKLKEEGFTNVKETKSFDPTVTVDKVIKTVPDRNEEVSKDTLIQVYVSTGKETELVTVTNFVGMTQSAAESRAKSMNLNPQFQEVNSTKPKGTVLEQSIPEKETVEEGSTIVFKVSNGVKEEITFPVSIKGLPTVSQKFVFTAKLNGTEIDKKTYNLNEISEYVVTVSDKDIAISTATLIIYVNEEGKSGEGTQFVKGTVNFSDKSFKETSRNDKVFEVAKAPTLTSLTITGAELEPVFDGKTLTYTATIKEDNQKISLSHTASDSSATVTIKHNGDKVTGDFEVIADDQIIITVEKSGLKTEYKITIEKE